MEQLLEKYAEVLLKTCLKVEKDQPLFISYNEERSDFVRIITRIAYSLGVNDIYYDSYDPYLKHEALKNLEVEDLKKSEFWNKDKWNIYAEKHAAFLMLASETPGLMKDIDSKKMSEITKYSFETRKVFDNKRDKSELAWCIAAVPTKDWAEALFENDPDAVNTLWNKIFEICSINNSDDPVKIWNEKISKLKRRADKLTAHQFKALS